MGYEHSATESIVPQKAEKHEGMRRSPIEDDDEGGSYGLVRTSGFRHLPSFLNNTNKVAPMNDDSDDDQPTPDRRAEN